MGSPKTAVDPRHHPPDDFAMNGAARAMTLFAGHGPGPDRPFDLRLNRLPQLGGAAVVVMTSPAAAEVVCLSGPLATRIEDIQLTLGQGPIIDAFTTGRAVTAADLAGAPYAERWPAFAPTAVRAGARAVFAFPLRIGVIKVGVLDLYRDRPGPLAADEFGDALVTADVVALLLLMDGHDPGPYQLHFGPDHGTAVHRATDMIMVQLRVGVTDALVRLRAYCDADGRDLEEVAQDVVDRRLRFDEMTD